jgi:hypothetical protein
MTTEWTNLQRRFDMTNNIPAELLQARTVDIANELLRRGVGLDEICSRLDIPSQEALWSFLNNEIICGRADDAK